MVKPEWGTKRTCPKCATRFYDLTKEDPVTCISCGHAWLPEPVLKSKQPLPFEEASPAAGAVVGEADADLGADLDLDVDAAEPSADFYVFLGVDYDLGFDTGEANDDH
ncbi:MAG: FYDLN acid domain-containing protein [Chakrabartia sp.]